MAPGIRRGAASARRGHWLRAGGVVKRSPLRRKTPLRAQSSLRRAVREAAVTITVDGVVMGRVKSLHSGTKHSRRERAFDFMGWTKRQPCMVRRFLDELHRAAGNRIMLLEQHVHCDGPIEADHAGNRYTQGNGTRAFDWTCIPMCRKHHRQRTDFAGTRGQAGIFFGFTCEMMRAWCNRAIEIHHALARRAGIAIPSC